MSIQTIKTVHMFYVIYIIMSCLAVHRAYRSRVRSWSRSDSRSQPGSPRGPGIWVPSTLVCLPPWWDSGGAQRGQYRMTMSWGEEKTHVSELIVLSQWQMDKVCRIDLKLLMSFYPIGVEWKGNTVRYFIYIWHFPSSARSLVRRCKALSLFCLKSFRDSVLFLKTMDEKYLWEATLKFV